MVLERKSPSLLQSVQTINIILTLHPQSQISSQSLLRNRESSVSAFRRERRKSEIGTASTMERRPVPLASKPVQKLSLSASGKRSPTSSRSFIPERRFSTGSGGADRPSRRSSDTSILSIDTSTEMKKRLSMRIPTGTSPAPFNLSPSKMAAKEYSFSEIYDSTTKLDADADLDKVNHIHHSVHFKCFSGM